MTSAPLDDRLHFPATSRNADPILDVLKGVLPERGTVLEVASGSGQHVAYFAGHFPNLTWQPTDLDPAHRRSIAAWTRDLDNVLAPKALDAAGDDWPLDAADAVVCCNMIHITPWGAGLGLLAGAGRVLSQGGVLFLYGPFQIGGTHTAESNARFDAGLRAQDPSWGVRDLDEVATAAESHGLTLEQSIPMPANNLSVIFRKTA